MTARATKLVDRIYKSCGVAGATVAALALASKATENDGYALTAEQAHWLKISADEALADAKRAASDLHWLAIQAPADATDAARPTPWPQPTE